MPGATYYKTSQEWLDNSINLIEAHPTTTRITTKYAIKPPRQQTDSAPAKPPRGNLILKTYDPVSGAALKYKTTKAAEVNRLIQGMGRLGRGMAGVAGAREALGEVVAAAAAAAEEAPVVEAKGKEAKGGQQGAQGAQAGKKKKKGRK